MSTPKSTERSASRSSGGNLSSPRRGPSEEIDAESRGVGAVVPRHVVVRLLAQKEDFERRIAERDERNNGLQKKLSRAETQVREAADCLGVERAERQKAEKVSAGTIRALNLQAEKLQAEIADLQGRGQSAMETIANLAHAKAEALEQLAISKAQIESLRADVVLAESLVDDLHAERTRRNAIYVNHEQERLSLRQALADANAKLAARAPVYVNERGPGGPPSRRVVAQTLGDARPGSSRRAYHPGLPVTMPGIL